MDPKTLKQLVKNEWILGGLMKLDKGEFHPGFNDFGPTVENHNGILYLAYYYILLRHWNLLDHSDTVAAQQIIERLTVVPGLYSRRPGGDLPEALDNYAGLTTIASLCGLDHFNKDIVSYGLKYGYTYDNLNPKKFNLFRWKQGADVAHYKICAGYTPTIWEIAWLCGGALWNCFFNKSHTSENLLTWVRFKGIEKALEDPNHPAPSSYKLALRLTKELWLMNLKNKTGGKGIEEILTIFFSNGHPIVSLAKGVQY